MQLQEIADVFSGRPVSRLREDGSTIRKRMLALRDVGTRLTPVDHLDEVDAPNTRETSRLAVRTGDVVATSRGRIRASVADDEHDGVLVGANLVVIRPNGLLPPGLIAAYLKHPAIEGDLLSEFAGTSTQGFSVESLKRLEINPILDGTATDIETLVELVEMYQTDITRAATLLRDAISEFVYLRLRPIGGANE